jgi:polyhydroxyalkanoate synthesis repressor PhaR
MGMAEKVLLKKYANRRIYDTEKSAYVTLNQVADIIREGRQVEVIDAKTEEDVTAFILTQIVLEESRKKNVLLPVPLLHLIIQYGENVLEEFFEKYLQQTIHNYLNYKKTVDEQFGKWLEVGMDLTDMAQKTMTGLTPFQSFFDQFSSSGDKEEDKQGG